MTDFTKGLEIGDKIFFQGYSDMYGDDCPLVRNDVGVVIELPKSESTKFKIHFKDKGEFYIHHFDIAQYKDLESMDPREKIQWEYSEWVDEYTELLEKSHVTMQEVQASYSGLALTWAIRELKALEPTEQIKDRIKYLEGLYEPKQ
jgi:hypothetical protein